MIENPVPVIPTELTVTVEVPVELRISDRVFELPSVTVPKFRLEVLSVS